VDCGEVTPVERKTLVEAGSSPFWWKEVTVTITGEKKEKGKV